jgi:hypothetical protein
MLYRAIAPGNWKRPLDFNLHSTHQGELQVPFSHHVRQVDPITSEVSFEYYAKLPAELQLKILHFCDAATLFQLMHTSRSTRTEAKKLFFSDPQTWYIVDGEWLLRSGYPGHTNHDLDFLACTERLNVEFTWMGARTWMSDEASGDWAGTEEEAAATGFGDMDKKIRDFWQTVTHRLPRLKHIILSDDVDRWDEEDSSGLELPPGIYRRVGRMCPPNINVSIYLVQGDGCWKRRMERKLWRRRLTNDSPTPTDATEAWDLCTDHPGMNVIPPYQPFRGPVGTHEESYLRVLNIAHQRKAIKILRIAAMERHHFHASHTPFTCPAPDCTARFDQPEEYTAHAIATKHDKAAKLPDPIEAAFAANDERLERLMDRAVEMERPFLEWWGKEGSEQRRVAEKEFIYQLEHDPLYALDKPVMEHPRLHAIWRSIDGCG